MRVFESAGDYVEEVGWITGYRRSTGVLDLFSSVFEFSAAFLFEATVASSCIVRVDCPFPGAFVMCIQVEYCIHGHMFASSRVWYFGPVK